VEEEVGEAMKRASHLFPFLLVAFVSLLIPLAATGQEPAQKPTYDYQFQGYDDPPQTFRFRDENNRKTLSLHIGDVLGDYKFILFRKITVYRASNPKVAAGEPYDESELIFENMATKERLVFVYYIERKFEQPLVPSPAKAD
jgi:hypothetical protein